MRRAEGGRLGRRGGGPTEARRGRASVSRTAQECQLASDEGSVAVLLQGEMLPDLRGDHRPDCSDGRLAPLPGPELFRRGAKKCRAGANALQHHPVLASGPNNSLQEQVAMLQRIQVQRAGLAVTPVRTPPVMVTKSRVAQWRAGNAGERDKLITSGCCRYLAEVEADEATLRKAEVAGSRGWGEGKLADGLAWLMRWDL